MSEPPPIYPEGSPFGVAKVLSVHPFYALKLRKMTDIYNFFERINCLISNNVYTIYSYFKVIFNRYFYWCDPSHEHVKVIPLKPADTAIIVSQHFPETSLWESFGIHQKTSPSHFNAFMVLRSREKNTYISPEIGECSFHDHIICIRSRIP